MKQLLDWLKPYISLWVLFPIALLILIPTGMIFLPFDQVLPAEILNILQQLATPKKMAIMLILFLSMSFCYAFLYREFSKRTNIKDYEHTSPPGFYKHKISGEYYCKKCLLKDNIAVPLSPINTKEFHCRLCNETYKVDYNVLICNSYLSITQDNDPLFKTHDKAVNELILNKENGQQDVEGDRV